METVNIDLYPHQKEALKYMKNGCILCGGVGSGKSRTALMYYFIQNEGIIESNKYIPMSDPPQDLYIITTARKRDSLEWDGELAIFLLSQDRKNNFYNHKVIVDSWNNIKKYENISKAFFIFDEDRVVGSGAWVKAFLKIAKSNSWILLSATPGDTWTDYIPVFIANNFYRNRSDFLRQHVIYSRFCKYPKVDKYLDQGILVKHRNDILVSMDFKRHTISHHLDIFVNYDKLLSQKISRDRWNIFKDCPIKTASEFCYVLRKLVNSDDSRQAALLNLLEKHTKAIIFYNFDYELEILQKLYYSEVTETAAWNGHTHEEVPINNKWVYFVQYSAGCEAWNCVTTDTIIFYSQTYSYRTLVQACGRINRLNSPFIDLYYYHLKSRSGIDLAISQALHQKKKFNENSYFERKL
jgi:hypothetical protein